MAAPTEDDVREELEEIDGLLGIADRDHVQTALFTAGARAALRWVLGDSESRPTEPEALEEWPGL